jgi:hypothetical protein
LQSYSKTKSKLNYVLLKKKKTFKIYLLYLISIKIECPLGQASHTLFNYSILIKTLNKKIKVKKKARHLAH